MEALKLQSDGFDTYTYADYASWDTDQRYELIDGIPYLMAAPSENHQTIAGEIFRQLSNFLIGKPCKALMSPFDVCINALGDDDDTVLQPDVLVVCGRSKMDGKRCNGAPDMVVEVVSPSSGKKDRLLKLPKYQKAGVRECWIVEPKTRTVQVGVLTKGKYAVAAYGEADTVPVGILEGCSIDLGLVFADMSPEGGKAKGGFRYIRA
uniref:Putative restriction endonuclease domain-containing protein n=1 Tax=uncultured bacterium contig00081 TaxID=1181557 RepID=A0A806KMH1_9BACT|nr:hypothetical protein [uncultured bacterium contig00081]